MATDNGSPEFVDDDYVPTVTTEIGPFAFVPVWVLHVGLTGNELAVYVSLRSFADRATGKAYPYVKTIADRAGVSKKTAERAISVLRDKGLVTTTRRHRDDGSLAGCDYLLRDTPTVTVTVGTHGDDGRGTPEAVRGVPPRMTSQEQTTRTDQVFEPDRSFVAGHSVPSDARSASRRGALRSPAPQSDDERLEQKLGQLSHDEAMRVDAMLANGANVRAIENTIKKMRRDEAAEQRRSAGSTAGARDPWLVSSA